MRGTRRGILGAIASLVAISAARASTIKPSIGATCAAGGDHERYDRREEIGFSGKWIPLMMLTLGGTSLKWVQSFQACKKCGVLYMYEDKIVPKGDDDVWN